ncbi:MAG: hypothetical protein LBB05_01150 [Puniceicoccales bacterium]|nr:hypothetical protein [Puniceicoccales bacterium]
MEKKDQDLSNIVGICYEKIKGISGNNKYEMARLLLISQCKVWNEQEGQYELRIDKNETTVRSSIKLLYVLAQKQGEDAEKAQELLRSINGSRKWDSFFPDEYFE